MIEQRILNTKPKGVTSPHKHLRNAKGLPSPSLPSPILSPMSLGTKWENIGGGEELCLSPYRWNPVLLLKCCLTVPTQGHTHTSHLFFHVHQSSTSPVVVLHSKVPVAWEGGELGRLPERLLRHDPPRLGLVEVEEALVRDFEDVPYHSVELALGIHDLLIAQLQGGRYHQGYTFVDPGVAHGYLHLLLHGLGSIYLASIYGHCYSVRYLLRNHQVNVYP